jgi:hypothetical protein
LRRLLPLPSLVLWKPPIRVFSLGLREGCFNARAGLHRGVLWAYKRATIFFPKPGTSGNRGICTKRALCRRSERLPAVLHAAHASAGEQAWSVLVSLVRDSMVAKHAHANMYAITSRRFHRTGQASPTLAPYWMQNNLRDIVNIKICTASRQNFIKPNFADNLHCINISYEQDFR